MPINWKLVPYSRATTTYGLLETVKRVMRAEPLRVNMEHVMFDDSTQPLYQFAECGAQGCVKGWIEVVGGQRSEYPTDNIYLQAAEDYFPQNNLLLRDLNRLFFGGEYQDVEYPWPSHTLKGTREYAEAVIVNIEKFQAKWKKELKAHKLKRPSHRNYTLMSKLARLEGFR